MSISDWKAREKEQRREDILDAAMRLFYSKGYDSISMSDIAVAIGIKKPTLYLYFKNKEALFYAIVARSARLRNPLIRAEISKCKTADEMMIASGLVSARFYEQHPEYAWADFFFRSGRFDLRDTGNKDLKAVLDLHWELYEIMRGIIEKGKAEGAFVPDEDPLAMAVMLNMVAENAYQLRPDYRYMLERGGVGLDTFARCVDRLTRRAIMTPEKFAELDDPSRRAVIADDRPKPGSSRKSPR